MCGCLLLPFKLVFVLVKLAVGLLMFVLCLLFLPLLLLVGLAALLRSLF